MHAEAEIANVHRFAPLSAAARCHWTAVAVPEGSWSEKTTSAQHHARRVGKVCTGTAGDPIPLVVCFKLGFYLLSSPHVTSRAKALFYREHASTQAAKARRFCRHRGCDRAVAYGEPGARRASFCPNHRNSSHVDFAYAAR
jgi:hypothetical protein